MIKVVIVLTNYSTFEVMFNTMESAGEFIGNWHKMQCERILAGKSHDQDEVAYLWKANEGGVYSSALLGQYIAGMYIAGDKHTPAEKMAEAMNKIADATEKSVVEGNEWKDS